MTTPKQALEAARAYVKPSHTGDVQADADLRKIDEALASLQGEDAVERVARIISSKLKEHPATADELPDEFGVWCARAILATGLVPDEAAAISDDWIMNVVRYSTVGSGAVPNSEWCAFARAIIAALGAKIRADQRERDAEIAHHYFENLGPKDRWPLEKMQAAFEIAAAIRSGGGE